MRESTNARMFGLHSEIYLTEPNYQNKPTKENLWKQKQ